jgi:hypothetical protein
MDASLIGQAETSIARAASWIEQHADQFSLRHSADFEEALQLLKPIGELTLTLDILARCQVPFANLAKRRQWCWDELKQGEFLVEVLTIRPDLIVASAVYASFKHAGLVNARLERVLNHLIESPSALSLEMPTWRWLDLCHGFEALGLRPFPAEPERATWLAALPEPWTITDDIGYALTHNVFYITDFGARPDRLRRDIRDYILTWLPAWLTIYQRQPNWDLYAELLMVAACIRETGRFGPQFAQLHAAQQDDGMVCGPRGSAQLLIRDGTPPERSAFLQNYHTTLVALMAFALRSKYP